MAAPKRPSRARPSKRTGVSFDVTFPRGHAYWALTAAGVDAEAYRRLDGGLFDIARKPLEVPKGREQADCRYTAADPPALVRVTVLRYGLPTDLRIEVDDSAVGKKLRDALIRDSAKHQQDIAAELDHSLACQKLDEILARDKLVYDDVRYKKAVLTRRAIESIMQLCGEVMQSSHMALHDALTHVAKADREFVARWFLEELKKPNANSQLGVCIDAVVVPAIADEMIRIIENRRYGTRRNSLCLSLARTKHKRAAELAASVLGEPAMSFYALEALGRLKAVEHAAAIRKLTKDKDADIRRKAQKTLKKLGLAGDAAPPPKHLVKVRAAAPKDFGEWSTNLDIGELPSVLQALSKSVDKGFGAAEKAEVAAVVDEMRVEQTKVFRFPITVGKKKSDLWLTIFMDDEDSPDLGVFAEPAVIRKLEKSVAE